MTTQPAPTGDDVAPATLAAAALLAVGLVPLLFAVPHNTIAVDATLPLLGWLPLGVAGVVAVDRRPGSRLGWSAVVAATTPAFAVVADAEPGPRWLLPMLLVAATAWTGRPETRDGRRWRVWAGAVPLLALGAAGLTWVLGSAEAFGVVAMLGLLGVAAVVAGSALVARPRPLDEPLLDALLVTGVLASGVCVGLALRWFGQREQVFAAEVIATFAGAMTWVLAAPGAWWIRRELLQRRYGAGVLSPEDVATITADLRTDADPRALLPKAAAMVSATSGTSEARIVLSDPLDDPLVATDEEGWRGYPLLVGDDTVGRLLVRAATEDGLEARQDRVVAQLAPTVALVARAVALAVEAEHARHDLTHEREAERNRILADLHDDLGPMLAGMSMRVGAAQQVSPHEALEALAGDLAAARADLRRIVSGLTPSALTGTAAGEALEQLVASFRTDGGPEIALTGEVPSGTDGPPAVVVYRTVAEGVTNALRHGRPGNVRVHVVGVPDGLEVTVADDGTGGVVVPGVGLTSLRSRARELAGTLDVGPGPDGGTVLRLHLPAGSA